MYVISTLRVFSTGEEKDEYAKGIACAGGIMGTVSLFSAVE